jgi:hypothetical protein
LYTHVIPISSLFPYLNSAMMGVTSSYCPTSVPVPTAEKTFLLPVSKDVTFVVCK